MKVWRKWRSGWKPPCANPSRPRPPRRRPHLRKVTRLKPQLQLVPRHPTSLNSRWRVCWVVRPRNLAILPNGCRGRLKLTAAKVSENARTQSPLGLQMLSPLRIGEESAVASTNLSIFTTLENCRLEFTPASQSQLKDGNTCAAICRGISVCGFADDPSSEHRRSTP